MFSKQHVTLWLFKVDTLLPFLLAYFSWTFCHNREEAYRQTIWNKTSRPQCGVTSRGSDCFCLWGIGHEGHLIRCQAQLCDHFDGLSCQISRVHRKLAKWSWEKLSSAFLSSIEQLHSSSFEAFSVLCDLGAAQWTVDQFNDTKDNVSPRVAPVYW